MLKEILESKAGPHQSSGKFSISSVGCCWRKKFSELKGIYKEEFDEKMYRIFAQGDFFHQRIVSELISKGPQQGYHVAAAEVDIRSQKYISGRCDLILSHASSKQLYIVDFKSCSPWAFKNVQKGEVSQNYKDQVLLYEYIFHIPLGYLLFINKASSEVEEYEVLYDPARAEFLINQIKFFFENFVEVDKLPPYCLGGQWGCKCCWPVGNNKPSSAQLEATLKQQEQVQELFKEFVPIEAIIPQTKTEVASTNPQDIIIDKKWGKVLL